MLGLTGMGGGVGSLMFAGVAKTPFSLFAWGTNSWGQLGVNTAENYYSSPTQVGTDTDWAVVRAASQGYWSWFLKNDGTLWGSGRGANAVSGMGYNDGPEISSPVQLPGTYKSLYASKSTAAIKSDGSLWTWGDNQYGGLGHNNRTKYSSPRQVGTNTTWGSSDGDLTKEGASYHDMVVGKDSKILLKTNGTLWGVGRNDSDMNLGLNDRISRSSPTQIGTDTNWVQASGGERTAVAIKSDGTLWIWGHNNYGQIGAGGEAPQSSPLQIGTETTWATADSQNSVTVAIKTDGTLWSWGYNGRGDLGHNNKVVYSSPKQVGTDTNWATVSAADNVGATKTDGTAWTWGANQWTGTGGQNDVVARSSPTQLGTGTKWQRLDISASAAFGLQTVD